MLESKDHYYHYTLLFCIHLIHNSSIHSNVDNEYGDSDDTPRNRIKRKSTQSGYLPTNPHLNKKAITDRNVVASWPTRTNPCPPSIPRLEPLSPRSRSTLASLPRSVPRLLESRLRFVLNLGSGGKCRVIDRWALGSYGMESGASHMSVDSSRVPTSVPAVPPPTIILPVKDLTDSRSTSVPSDT